MTAKIIDAGGSTVQLIRTPFDGLASIYALKRDVQVTVPGPGVFFLHIKDGWVNLCGMPPQKIQDCDIFGSYMIENIPEAPDWWNDREKKI